MNKRMSEYNARRKIDNDRTVERKKRARRVSKEFKQKIIDEGKCRNPACHRTIKFHKLSGHHIVHRSSFSPYDAERDNPNNAMPLCFPCHSEYHRGNLPTNRKWLSEDEQAFIIEHKGSDWIDRIYPIA